MLINMGTVSNTLSEAKANDVRASIYSHEEQSDDALRIFRRTDFQARLGRKLDNIRKRVLDNNIRLSAHPTDMLRIAVQRDERSHDLI